MGGTSEEIGRYDVIVIGGGINGTSAARALSSSGYDVLLAEKGDFASGASGRSSRILHCGLRYFETARPVRTFLGAPSRLKNAVAMAKAAMVAREELVRLRPGRCKPFTMCFPLYRNDALRGWHLDAAFALLKRLGPAQPPLDYRRVTGDFERGVPIAKVLFAGDPMIGVILLPIMLFHQLLLIACAMLAQHWSRQAADRG